MTKTMTDGLLQPVPAQTAQAEDPPRRGMTNRAKGWLIAIAFSLIGWAIIVIGVIAFWPG